MFSVILLVATPWPLAATSSPGDPPSSGGLLFYFGENDLSLERPPDQEPRTRDLQLDADANGLVSGVGHSGRWLSDFLATILTVGEVLGVSVFLTTDLPSVVVRQVEIHLATDGGAGGYRLGDGIQVYETGVAIQAGTILEFVVPVARERLHLVNPDKIRLDLTVVVAGPSADGTGAIKVAYGSDATPSSLWVPAMEASKGWATSHSFFLQGRDMTYAPVRPNETTPAVLWCTACTATAETLLEFGTFTPNDPLEFVTALFLRVYLVRPIQQGPVDPEATYFLWAQSVRAKLTLNGEPIDETRSYSGLPSTAGAPPAYVLYFGLRLPPDGVAANDSLRVSLLVNAATDGDVIAYGFPYGSALFAAGMFFGANGTGEGAGPQPDDPADGGSVPGPASMTIAVALALVLRRLRHVAA